MDLGQVGSGELVIARNAQVENRGLDGAARRAVDLDQTAGGQPKI
jgi:hypothetical protein